MFTSSIFKFNDLYGFSFLEWKRTKLVFKILRASLLDFIHSAIAWSYWFRISSISQRFLREQYILVLSANKWKLSSSEVFGKSLIYSKKKQGSKNGSLRYSTSDWDRIRFMAVYKYKFFSIGQIRLKPVIGFPSHSVMIQFWEKNGMISCIKCLF